MMGTMCVSQYSHGLSKLYVQIKDCPSSSQFGYVLLAQFKVTCRVIENLFLARLGCLHIFPKYLPIKSLAI